MMDRRQTQASCNQFQYRLATFSCLSNHFQLNLRSRRDVVVSWNDKELAGRWLMLCPIRKNEDLAAKEPNEFELNSFRNGPEKLATIRTRRRKNTCGLSAGGWN
ncbi:MAG: hypothetical protein NTU79_09415 [Planctomycetota bacterium]|nr:hypothetical protein [Planctomycetota bacterium]